MKGTKVKLLALCMIFLVVFNISSPKISLAESPDKNYSDVKLLDKERGYSPDELIVKFKPNTSEKEKDNIKTKLNIKSEKKFSSIGSELIKLRDKSKLHNILTMLKKNKHIEYVEPNYLYKSDVIVNDPYFSNLWGLENTADIDIDAPEAWDITQGSRDIIVAVIDSGVDINHPDIKDNIWINPGEIANDGIDNDGNGFIDDINGWDFYYNDNSVFDSTIDDEHGTHVAGTIAASSNNNIGIVGVAPNVKILPIKFLGPSGGYTSDAIEAIEYAKQMGATIASNSWGGGSYSTALRDAINSFDGVFVAAAGNDSMDTDIYPHYPSSYDCSNIISVASVDSSGGLSYFSNYGVNTVDVSAPGSSIYSLKPGSSYQYLSGTSMATPHVSGVVALLLSINNSLTPTEVLDIVKNTSEPLTSLQGITASGGMVNAFNSVNSIKGKGPYVTLSDPINGAEEVSLDEQIVITFSENVQPGINFSNILLKNNETVVESVYDLTENILTITPTQLNNNGNYVLEIPTDSVLNQSGIGINAPYYLKFKTPDTLEPKVINTDPLEGANDVSIDKIVTITFDEDIKEGSNFSNININGNPVQSYLKTISGNTLTIDTFKLGYSSLQNINIPSEAVSDLKGNTLSTQFTLSYTTMDDNISPSLSYTDPEKKSFDVPLNKTIYINFSEDIKAGINYDSITLKSADNTEVGLSKSIDGTRLALKPLSNLASYTSYTVNIPIDSIVDLTGNLLSSVVTIDFTTTPYDIRELPRYIDDAVIDPNNPIVYILSGYEGLLTSYNYSTGETKEINLGYSANSIDIGKGQYPDEIYVGLTNNTPQLEEGTNLGSIVIVDKDSFIIKDTIPTNIEPFDVIGGRDGHIYVTSATGQWTDMESYNRVTKELTHSTGIRHQSFGKLHPIMERIYTIDTDVSPRDFTAYNIENGVFTDPTYPGGYDSPYHGDYSLDVNFKIDPTGNFLFNGSGNIFSTNMDASKDMQYIGTLDRNFIDIAFENDASKLYALDTNNTLISVYSGSNFDLIDSLKLGGYGRFIFKQDNKLIVLVDLMQYSSYSPTGVQILDIPNTPPNVVSTDPFNNESNVDINRSIRVSFDENIEPGTLYNSISLVDRNGQPTLITKTISGNVLLIENNGLNYSTTYDLNIPVEAIQDSSGYNLMKVFMTSFSTEAKPDTLSPTITSTTPINGSENIPITQQITISFSEDITQGSDFSGISLKDSLGNITENIKSINGNVLSIITNTLKYNTSYTLTIPINSVEDISGNGLLDSYNIVFTTEAEPDTIAPSIISTNPKNTSTDIPIETSISINFDENIVEGSTYSLIELKDSSNSNVNITKSLVGSTLTVNSSILNYSEEYTLTIPANSLSDLSGNEMMTENTLTFTTESQPDTIAPTINITDPNNGDTNVPINKTISITFSEDIIVGDAYNNISLSYENNNVNITKNISGNILTLKPESLLYSTNYSINIPVGAVKDTSENLFESQVTLGFTTESAPIVDNEAPYVVSTNPNNGDNNVVSNQPIVITFNENITIGANIDLITLTRGKKSYSFTYSINGNELIIYPDNLTPKSTIDVTIPSGAVKDGADNLSKPYSFTFTTAKN